MTVTGARSERRPSPAVLAVLARMTQHRAWEHGYDLMVNTGLPSGSVYPILHRLRERGRAESRIEAGDPVALGRPLRTYWRLTAAGLEYAAQHQLPAPHRLTPPPNQS